MNDRYRIIGITMGDPAGIGAEIAVKAIERGRFPKNVATVVVGDCCPITDAMKFTNSRLELNIVRNISDIRGDAGILNLMDMGMIGKGDWKYGVVSKAAGMAALSYIERAVQLALEGKLEAVVTCPINKQSLSLTGCPYPGHTEIFASLTRTGDYAMMLVHGQLRVAHVSTHVSLLEACRRVTRRRVLTVMNLTNEVLQKMDIDSPLIAVAGLNPHAGEDGLFGQEERDEIIPAIEDAKGLGVRVEGPIPPDTVFARTLGGQYDAVVAMYHDQGHIPVKTAGFSFDEETGRWTNVGGVNITLGLPIIRTSVDHGTAFGKAGKGSANHESMEQAIEMAIQLCN